MHVRARHHPPLLTAAGRARPAVVPCARVLGRIAPRSVAVGVAMLFAMVAAAAGPEESTDSVAAPPRRSQQEVMAAQGFVRYRGAWRTVQEIELIERAERANVARKEWVVRLERLRQQCDQPAQSGRAAAEIRGISDPFAVPAEALGRLGDASAVAPLIEALETTHVAVVGDGGPEGSTTATFTPAGGGLSMGGGRRRASVPVKNERVLESLVTLTGANFGWDAAAWRAWLANRQSPPDFDPRRG